MRIVIEGLPGLEVVEGSGETVAWGTEKPVMVAALAEDPGDPDEGLEQGTSDDEELSDTGDADEGDEADVDDEGDE